MERRNLELSNPTETAAQTPPCGRVALDDYVERVTSSVQQFVAQSVGHRRHDYLDRWRTGARIVASISDIEALPTEFRPSRTFISFCGLADVDQPKLEPLRRYLVNQTDHHLAVAAHDLLPPEDVELLVRAGLRHGRPATRGLLNVILPHLVELEYGIAASIGIRVRHAMKDAA